MRNQIFSCRNSHYKANNCFFCVNIFRYTKSQNYMWVFVSTYVCIFNRSLYCYLFIFLFLFSVNLVSTCRLLWRKMKVKLNGMEERVVLMYHWKWSGNMTLWTSDKICRTVLMQVFTRCMHVGICVYVFCVHVCVILMRKSLLKLSIKDFSCWDFWFLTGQLLCE